MGRRASPEVREKRTKLLEMMRAGIEPDAIAERVGYKNGETVRSIYWEEINKRRNVAREDAVAVHLDRLEGMFQGVYPDARKGKEKSIRAGVKVLERMAKLEGLDKLDELEERRVELAEDSVDLCHQAMNAVLDAIGLTPEQEAIRVAVVKEQTAILTGTAFVDLGSLIQEQDRKNEAILAELSIGGGEDEDE